MFRCKLCGEVSKPKEPMTKIVVETRQVAYTNEQGQVTGTGTEIVREAAVCHSCIKG